MASATTIENIAATMAALSETLADLPGYNLLATSTTAATIIKSSSEPSTRENGDALQPNDIWFDTDDGQIYTRNTANTAWVAGRDATLVNVFGATSFTGGTLTAAMATAQLDIVTVTNAQSSTASSLSSLTSTVNSNTAAISSEATTRANADSALSTSITALQSSTGTNSASITTLQTATTNLQNDANAAYVLKVEANGSVSGMVLEANASGAGSGSAVQFTSDKFAIWNGSSGIAPFIVDGGVVYIDQARIKDGAILDAKIGSLDGGKITANTITATQIDANTITATQIATDTITATQIAGNTITAGEIAAGTITATEIDVDTLNVKHFDNVSADIFNQTGGTVPLAVYNSASQYNGSYPGDVINSVEAVYLPITVNNVRNGATYQVLYSAVLGDVRNGTLQYSFNGSTWVSLSPVVEADAGVFRTYAFMWQGTLTGMSSSQETVYWRMNFNVSGSVHNSTYQSMYVYIDNTT
jgi:hypothetical protein